MNWEKMTSEFLEFLVRKPEYDRVISEEIIGSEETNIMEITVLQILKILDQETLVTGNTG